MLASIGNGLIKAAAPKVSQLAAGAMASYHVLYDVGNSTNIKWCALQGLLLQKRLLSFSVLQMY